ncbi:hypothetical protein B0T22DRAFT_189611 [Podospora appendiculata]|uniref:Zn(2)-C6 fungal-type domain-containing protein n=1 Tax=Podospora appendiculata TaxID=314037 RepID=A0AAE1CE00_9PEZI|nr:hypothetical protein B0T22DRAFT_189611 [Podospora appendiculata]
MEPPSNAEHQRMASPLPSTNSRQSIKFRLSCDQCQDIRIKCSRDKPRCARCGKRGIGCVYSPVRKMGRPRKQPSSMSVTPPQAASTSTIADSPRHGTRRRLSANNPAIAGDLDTLPRVSLIGANDTPMPDVPFDAILAENQPNPAIPNPEPATCYIAILLQTTRLEQSLSLTTASPLHVFLEAERDFQTLKSRLLSCAGHPLRSADLGHNHPCLSSNRPVLFTLALLAEHIVCILEDVCRSLPTTPLQDEQNLFRDSLVQQSQSSPVHSALSHDVRVGSYLLEPDAGDRVTRQILRLRTRRLLAALEEMGDLVAGQEGVMRTAGGLLNLEGEASAVVLRGAAGRLLGSLIQRLVSL